jgi:type II restriction/modification system DNA methylase subunit YeeA
MESGGDFDLNEIAHFNGGLFDGRRALPLQFDEIGLLQAAATLDWSQIDPTIFGTLFERFLDPGKRAQIGAHYTDPDKIMLIVEPIILRPLREEWAAAKTGIEQLADQARLKRGKAFVNAMGHAEEARSKFIERLGNVTILDPACGSGNFLYLALQGVKDLELKANLECETMGLMPRVPTIGPEIVHGIEINPLAAELARTTIWIGDIQWRIRNGIHARPDPIFRKLDSIECRDALVTMARDGEIAEAQWPDAEFIVGNPPFLGASRMIKGLGEGYVRALRECFEGRVPGFADLVCFWFSKADIQLSSRVSARAGFVVTNSIRGGENRFVVEQIAEKYKIIDGWSDEEWVVEGAAVRVSLICFKISSDLHSDFTQLDGRSVNRINPDLTSSIDLLPARRLKANSNVAFLGTKKGGPFDINGDVAHKMLLSPTNPNGRTNVDVIRPRITGTDMVKRSLDKWVIDFDHNVSLNDAVLYEVPFQHVLTYVKPVRELNPRARRKEIWWLHSETAPGMRASTRNLTRFIGTPRVAKYRLFVWLHPSVLVDDGG